MPVPESVQPLEPGQRPWQLGEIVSIFRFRQWWYFTLLPLSAWQVGRPWAAQIPSFVAATLSAAACMGYGYGLNAVSDRATDLDPKKNPLVGRDVPRAARAMLMWAGLAALVAAHWANRGASLIAAISLAASTVYSAGPRWKAAPWLGTLLNVPLFVPLLWLGPVQQRLPYLPQISCIFAILLVQNQLLHELVDADEDRRGRVWTTGQLLGALWVQRLIAMMAFFTAGLQMALAPSSPLAAVGIVATALPSLALVLTTNAARMRRIHRWLAMASGGLLWLVGQTDLGRWA